jgi:molybdenum cofactor cytidylyltransferase
MRKVPVDEAVGMELGYDITKIVPGKEKYRAYRRGHVIRPEDVPRLKDMGKEHVYVWVPGDNMVHEDEAALRLAKSGRRAGNRLCGAQPGTGKPQGLP